MYIYWYIFIESFLNQFGKTFEFIITQKRYKLIGYFPLLYVALELLIKLPYE